MPYTQEETAQLCRDYHRLAVNRAWRFARQMQDMQPANIEDLYQHAMIGLVKAARHGSPDTPPTPILVRQCMYHEMRKVRQRPWHATEHRSEDAPGLSVFARLSDHRANPVEQTANRLDSARIRREMDNLPIAQQLAVIQHYLEDREVPEIAESLGQSKQAVNQALHRGIKRLKVSLNPTLEAA